MCSIRSQLGFRKHINSVNRRCNHQLNDCNESSNSKNKINLLYEKTLSSYQPPCQRLEQLEPKRHYFDLLLFVVRQIVHVVQ